jgi:hypothetical protein
MHTNIFVPESQVATIEFGMNAKGFRCIFCTLATAGIAILYLKPKKGIIFKFWVQNMNLVTCVVEGCSG